MSARKYRSVPDGFEISSGAGVSSLTDWPPAVESVNRARGIGPSRRRPGISVDHGERSTTPERLNPISIYGAQLPEFAVDASLDREGSPPREQGSE